MRLLLDTHVLLWWLTADTRLGDVGRGAIADPGNSIVVSAASVWEVAIKAALGRIRVEEALPESVEAEGFDLLPVTAHHAWAQTALPLHHRDPFDRMLVAQAQAEGMTLVTADATLSEYDVDLLLLG